MCISALMCIYYIHCVNANLYFVATCERPFGPLLLNKSIDWLIDWLADHFIAQTKEASCVRCNRIHVYRHGPVHYNLGFHEHGHRAGRLHTVGSLPQLCWREGIHCIWLFLYVPVAADHDAVLLLANCLRTKKQGNYRVVIPTNILDRCVTLTVVTINWLHRRG